MEVKITYSRHTPLNSPFSSNVTMIIFNFIHLILHKLTTILEKLTTLNKKIHQIKSNKNNQRSIEWQPHTQVTKTTHLCKSDSKKEYANYFKLLFFERANEFFNFQLLK